MQRLFLGLALSPEARCAVGDLLARWPGLGSLPGAKWTHRDDWHITLVFLGNVDKPERDVLIEAVDRQTLGSSFATRLSFAGAFSSPERARILWLGVDAFGEEQLTALHKETAGRCAAVGLPGDSKDFRPHLTLARFGKRLDVTAVLEKAPAVSIPIHFSRVVLFASVDRDSFRSPHESRYQELVCFSLESPSLSSNT